MYISFIKADLNILNMKARMPFKYGIATLTALPHLFVRVELLINDKVSIGISSDGLAPKWFTKDPTSSFEDDINEMFMVIQNAVKLAQEIEQKENIFLFWKELYKKQAEWGKKTKLPPLLTSFGVSLVERAVISAFCQACNQPFHELIKDGRLGFNLQDIYPEFDNSTLRQALPKLPSDNIEVRHTVGLADPITRDEIEATEIVDDGLPESFEENMRVYGIKKLKIKLSGNLEFDKERLLKIQQIMTNLNRDFSFTLDGNEFFICAEDFKDYWEKLSNISQLKSLFERLLFVEQPIHRDFALSEETGKCFKSWKAKPKIIIDESDAELHSAQKALALGYSGTSHKNCKGIFKSIANACLMYKNKGILSAEDLCNVGPVALQQDIATVAALGISHVERNGHQYMPGLSMFPENIRQETVSRHGDLYKVHNGFPVVNISSGSININSVNKSSFGIDTFFDSRQFTPIEDWNFSSLGLC